MLDEIFRQQKFDTTISAKTTFHTPKRTFHTMWRVKRSGTLFFCLLLQPVRIGDGADGNRIINFKNMCFVRVKSGRQRPARKVNAELNGIESVPKSVSC